MPIKSFPDLCLPDGADSLFWELQSSSVTSDPCSLRFSPDINVETCPHSIQVNGLNVQGATHQEAVSALRNAGSCIKMTVLRDRTSDPGGPQDQRDAVERQLCRPTVESAEEPPSLKMEANFCNGNGVVGSSAEYPSREEILNFLIVFAQCLKRRRGMEKNNASNRNSHNCPLFLLSLCSCWVLGVSRKGRFLTWKWGTFCTGRNKQWP